MGKFLKKTIANGRVIKKVTASVTVCEICMPVRPIALDNIKRVGINTSPLLRADKNVADLFLPMLWKVILMHIESGWKKRAKSCAFKAKEPISITAGSSRNIPTRPSLNNKPTTASMLSKASPVKSVKKNPFFTREYFFAP